MERFTRAYWIFWLGILPIVYWQGSPDYEFPKFIVLLAGVNLWGIGYMTRTKNNFLEIRNPIDRLVIGTGLVATLSWLLNGFEINGLIGESYRYQGLITTWSLIEWYLLSKNMIMDGKNWLMVIRWTGLWLALLALVFPLMGNPNFIAAYLVLLASCINRWEGKISSGVITWISSSRSAGLAWIISILLSVRKKYLVLIILAGVGLVFIFPKKLPSHFDNRMIIWQKSVELVQKKPIFGWGPESFDRAFGMVLTANDFDLKNIRVDRAHNLVLDILANIGLSGLIVWLMLFYWLFKKGPKRERIFLCSFLIISNLNVINLNTWLLFYLEASKISQSLDERMDQT
jgi:O-antigen ligase